ncbi:MAG TPA: alpha-glucan family phosphorylase [Thermoanaerobaculia bacterium]|jgi:starch phosphorylase|nr:alpha-glucan family phosphorylase [Thermoanaerobaculia bacterium]
MTTAAAPPTPNVALPQVPWQHVADIELPREVQGLYELAYNLWWTWSPKATELFEDIDRRAWSHYHNPVQMLINVERRQWEHLIDNDNFLEAYSSVVEELQAYMSGAANAWFWRQHPEYDRGPIAYLSMEYGVHQALAIYSGGLGILSGDHLKSASDLAVPLVAVGLLYRSGYFQQTVDPDGHQQHTYPEYDFSRLPVRPVAGPTGRDVVVSVPIADREVQVKVWVAQVGRVPLLLLDTDIAENDPADRPITTMLYVQGRAMRLAQEIVLGIGGVRALKACGLEPAAWHINEGHSALLQLERIAGELAKDGVSFDEALQRVRATTVFTTHTPVPAGNESFDGDLAWRYLGPWGDRLGVGWDAVRAQAQTDPRSADGSLNLTALALRTARYANGVSDIHGAVSRRMWQPLFGAAEPDAVPIDHVTNGVHLPTWLGREMQDLLRRHLGPQWQGQIHYPSAAGKLAEVPGEELWQAHQAQKRRLCRFTQSRLRDQLARHGRSPEELREVESFFRPEALTIGFARRFATYKRANLVFTDPHELRRLISSETRPVQILFAGKAHPADRPGQDLIQHIFQLSQQPPFRGRVFFLENYDMRVARMLVQGVDVWLNTPRRPLEASGTSGQKAGINGALNCSVLDGWWPEAYDRENPNGWAIGRQEVLADVGAQDMEDAHALYEVLAEEVVPAFFERDERELPLRWLQMMSRSIATIAPLFSSDRMVRDYVNKAYLAGVSRASGE